MQLKRARLNEGLEALGGSGFFENSGLADVELPGTLRALGEGTFRGCGSLKRVNLPSGLREIGAGAFYGSGVAEVAFSAKKTREL